MTESGSPSQLYSSFDYGNMHIVSYSFEEEFGLAPDTKKGAEQYDWLVNDLEVSDGCIGLCHYYHLLILIILILAH